MNIVQITPGAGRMYCGNCLRDNALVRAWRAQGHAVLMVPLYLPLTLDEPDGSEGVPIFFSGLNVYLDQKAALFRSAPAWLRRRLASPSLLRWAGRFAVRTRPVQVAEMTLSMLRGEEGHQARDLEELIAWLRTQPRPDTVCLSNALLVGFARRIRSELGTPVAGFLAGEDEFLDAMPEPFKTRVWDVLAERAAEVDAWIAPSRYFAERMGPRLRLPPDRLHVLPVGLDLDGYPAPADSTVAADTGTLRNATPPVLGYFARMCPDKGLDLLVEAFLEITRRGSVPGLQLAVGGSCGPADEPFVRRLEGQIRAAGLSHAVQFHPNLDRAAKLRFLSALTLFSVPARVGEAFGLYVIEAMAAGVPVVQPRRGAFPEVIEATDGGRLFEPENVASLAETIESLLRDPAACRRLGAAGQTAVHRRFAINAVARQHAELFECLPGSR
ncbi:MAG TPA: glycosyltransferase family 4 protein [Verrucomicrobiota bacterium]|nr:glycosyltransferase family 4 protein [Verrucomicrobiota bacterium]HNU49542.1 glycosyltransferase family 4 protein [Verrucomicrobiota bacterium]